MQQVTDFSDSSPTDGHLKSVKHDERTNSTRTTVNSDPPSRTLMCQILSAIFYGVASFLITIVNKTVLTTYSFPSFQVLGLGQMGTTVLALYVAKTLKVISFPDLSISTFTKTWPLPVIYLGNMVFGLGGTKELSLPMFTALRRFSIYMTMAAEYYLLAVQPSKPIQYSVHIMIIGAVIAASHDLSFNMYGYVLVFLSDFFTAVLGVVTKQKLESKELGKFGVMYYNSLVMFAPAIVFAWHTGEIQKAVDYPLWRDPRFFLQFSLSCVMGFILSYSVIVCTHFNSALTTAIVGCLKNILVTYMGMIIWGDYIFSWTNFAGINISVLGSLIYTWLTFQRKL